ncbi:MAG: hypothetical protein GTO18_10255 [Anaerolineales bacterium]|nr:hypothetical protein [Anaerolineales bacterium]
MKHIGILGLSIVFLTAVVGCVQETPTPLPPIEKDQDYSEMIEVGGVERIYYVHLPSTTAPREPWPVLLFFHGFRYPVEPMRELIEYDALAEEQGFVAVYPLGYHEMWQSDESISNRYATDDIEFVNAIIDEIQDDLPVDPKRIYAVGFSNGGFFSSRLACELSDRIAAFGSVAGTMSDALLELPEPCAPPAPVPIVYIHGTEDDRVYFYQESQGGLSASGALMSIPDTIDFWLGINACGESPTVEDIPDVPDDGTQVTKEFYGDCQEGAEVVLYAIEGGGHTWPGNMDYAEAAREVGVGLISADLDATNALWEFVSKFSLP